MENQRLLMGISDFDKIIKEDVFVVDKSLFIKEFMEDDAQVSAILRPRRFGKSLNLSMLKSFLSTGADPGAFDRFLIGKEKKFVSEHCGKYPVVFLDLKDCKGDDWEDMCWSIWCSLQTMLQDHFELNQVPLDINFATVHPPKDFRQVRDLLFRLTGILHRKYHRSVIILVDEYDTPLNDAFGKGFYDQASKFFGAFFSRALKGNPAVEKACLMGIVEVCGAGILSGLNNFAVYSVDKKRYEACFGFTCDEIKDMLYSKNKSGSYDEIMRWYNGYHIGKMTVINLWSFINWIRYDEFSSYWCRTSHTGTLSTLLGPYIEPNLIASISTLMATETRESKTTYKRLEISPLSSEVNYSKKNWDHDSIMHFLVLTGYLTYQPKATTGEVWIPNHEILTQWKLDILPLFRQEFAPVFQSSLSEIFTSSGFDGVALQGLMQRMLLHCSSHDVNFRNESSYHMFYFGVFFSLFHSDQIQVTSNRESGKGRNDIQMLFRNNLKRCFVIEFKLSTAERFLERDAKRALDQIIKNKYASESLDLGFTCIGLGIAFHGKEVSGIHWQLL